LLNTVSKTINLPFVADFAGLLILGNHDIMKKVMNEATWKKQLQMRKSSANSGKALETQMKNWTN